MSDCVRPEIVLQPPGSKLCGHACLAMMLGIPLGRAVVLLGHRRSTKTRELARMLRAHGHVCDDRLRSFAGRGLPILFRGLAKLSRLQGRNWHWVVAWDGVVLDPLAGERRLPYGFKSGCRLTSGLRVVAGPSAVTWPSTPQNEVVSTALREWALS